MLERDLVSPSRAERASGEQLDADSLLHHFTVVFDSSPAFLAKMKNRRIACLTCRKYPGVDWPKEEFLPTEFCLASRKRTTIQLANGERGGATGYGCARSAS